MLQGCGQVGSSRALLRQGSEHSAEGALPVPRTPRTEKSPSCSDWENKQARWEPTSQASSRLSPI